MKKKPFFQKSITVSKTIFLVTVMSSMFFFGCKKEFSNNESTIAVKGSTDVAIPTYDFNWETATYMPTPAGYQIPMPWIEGLGSSICTTYPEDVYLDYKSYNGWKLVYSGFNPTTIPTSANSYFILYNRFRGLLRIFQYNLEGGLTTSSKIQSGINWIANGNGSSKSLNFVGKDIVDANGSQTAYTAIEPTPQNSSELPVHGNKWYMMQYEIAYDPTLSYTNSTTSPPKLSWYLNYIDITSVDLAGTATGTISGTIGSNSLQSDIVNTALTNGAKDIGKVGLSALGTNFFSTNKLGLSTNVYTAVKSGISSALSSATGNLPGSIINIFSAMLGGGSTSAQTVKLDLSANLKLNGTFTSNGSLFSGTVIAMPGTLATYGANNTYYYTEGYTPVFNEPLGLFNLSNRPKVNCKNTVRDHHYVSSMYTLDENSYQIQWNPNIVSGQATIQNLTKEIIVFVSESRPNAQFTGRQELWGGAIPNYYFNKYREWKCFANKAPYCYVDYYDDFDWWIDPYWNDQSLSNIDAVSRVCVRISFNVVPKNGAPATTVVKTFLADTPTELELIGCTITY